MDEKKVKVIDTASGAKDGQTKCPKCGATDISVNPNTGQLRCNFCRHSFTLEVSDVMKEDVGTLSGESVGSGAADIDKNADQTVTLKCTSCGAEVVIDLSESSQARCHWCRNMLSINSKVPNGTVPDVVLPFKMKKDEAKERIEGFVGKRQFYANKTFQKEFTTENIMGVYFPYMLVDMKGHASFAGEGEIERGQHEEGEGNHKRTVYDVERFKITRECDVEIDDLALESSARRASGGSDETNNIINAILPFDTENAVAYDANYLHGYTSEKRDVNKGDLQKIADSQEKEAVKHALLSSIKEYDRGVKWEKQEVKKEGEKWIAAYLPVWLYSYVENPGTAGQLTHYVAVNARTAETIGSVPVNKSRITGVAVGIGAALFAVLLLIFYFTQGALQSGSLFIAVLVGVLGAFIFYGSTFSKYRNTGARHHFENETKLKLQNLKKTDEKLKRFRTEESVMQGANHKTVEVKKLETA